MNDKVVALNELADNLTEMQKWRRGEGKYAWNENPEVNNAPAPFSPQEFGRMIDRAIGVIRNIAKELS